MKCSRLILLLLFGMTVHWLSAQDCDDPTQLCYNPIPGNNQVFDSTTTAGGIDLLPLDCFMGTNGVLYEIQTISAGVLNVEISNIDCDSLDNPAYGDSLEVVLFQAPDPCNVAVSVEHACATGLGIIELDFIAGDSAEVYYLAVMGQMGDLFPAECGYAVQISGESVEFDFNATPEFTIDQGESVELETLGGLDNYQWSPSETLDFDTVPTPTATPLISTTYTVTGDVAGCEVSAEVFVEVIPNIRAANIITPDGNDLNDIWVITGLSQFPNADVRLFSRWGQQVFRSVGYQEPWDGTFGGTRVPAGTYYYVIEKNVPGEDTEPVTGSVAVVY